MSEIDPSMYFEDEILIDFEDETRWAIDKINASIDESNRLAEEMHREMEKELGRPIPRPYPDMPVPYSGPRAVDRPTSAHRDARFDSADPFRSIEPGSRDAKDFAHERDSSGRPRWMKPFSKVDVLGHPTVFSDSFDPFRGRKR